MMTMQDWKGYFKGKKITVLGLGLLGRGVGDAEFLAKNGAELIVTDLKTETELAESLERLKSYPGITYHLGGHDFVDFQNRDYILKAAGVPLDSPYIAEAQNNGIPIKMSASWFAELAHIPVIGVTGTRGKTTTTMMLYDILKTAGKRALLGGNVRGVSTLALLDEATPHSVALMELDSWQLQGWGETKMSPNVSVFTTFYRDHLNYYGGNLDAYLADKAEIFLHQTETDTLVLGEQCAELVQEKYKGKIQSKVVIAKTGDLPEDLVLQIPGDHNRANAACTREAALALGISGEVYRRALSEFKGVPGRLENVGEVGGVTFYNDTTATTPEATIAAIKAFAPTHDKKIILIMGGSDKGLDMTGLAGELLKHVRSVLLLEGSGTERLVSRLQGVLIYQDTLQTPVYSTLKSAFADACTLAHKGDIILFSPAFASFGMFKNEYDRGDQFNALVKKHL